MMGWRDFFPLFTPVRFGHVVSDLFIPLSEIDFMNPPIRPVPPPPPSLEKGIAAETNQSINDSYDGDGRRQCGLKSEPDESQAAMIPGEIAEQQPEPDVSVLPSSYEGTSDFDVKPQPEVEICVPPPSDDEDDYTSDVDDEDNNLNGDRIDPEVDICIPPPSDEDTDDENWEYDNNDERVPPPINDEGDQSEFPHPAVEEFSYAVDEGVPYPVDVEYPINEGYGYLDTGGAYASGEMSAVGPYPIAGEVVFGVTDDLNGRIEDYGLMPRVELKKKEYKGDKEVVGFVPSHLRVKRKNVTKKTSETSKTKTYEPPQMPEQGYSVADDYNKFMDELSELT
jgi:hypothetical protein